MVCFLLINLQAIIVACNSWNKTFGVWLTKSSAKVTESHMLFYVPDAESIILLLLCERWEVLLRQILKVLDHDWGEKRTVREFPLHKWTPVVTVHVTHLSEAAQQQHLSHDLPGSGDHLIKNQHSSCHQHSSYTVPQAHTASGWI